MQNMHMGYILAKGTYGRDSDERLDLNKKIYVLSIHLGLNEKNFRNVIKQYMEEDNPPDEELKTWIKDKIDLISKYYKPWRKTLL